MVRRLQLGTSRLEALDPRVLDVFLDRSWMHLGEPRPVNGGQRGALLSRVGDVLRKHSISYVFREGFLRLCSSGRGAAKDKSLIEDMYESTNFMKFYYKKGDRLPFECESMDFVFSEHFLEHLFLDEALSLLRECRRILRPWGVIRTCVPDADLRTYELPEPLGFPDRRLPFSDPAKHKTRWSVYSLTEAVKLAGFEAVPLRYCDKSGSYVALRPADLAASYGECPDKRMVFDLSYVMRIDSLIVDGVKRSSGPPAAPGEAIRQRPLKN